MPFRRYGRKRRRYRPRRRRRYTRRKKAVTPRRNRRIFMSPRPQRIPQITPRRAQVILKNNSGWMNLSSWTWGSDTNAKYMNSPKQFGQSATAVANDTALVLQLNNPGMCWRPLAKTDTGTPGLDPAAGHQPQFFDQYFAKYKYLRCYKSITHVDILSREIEEPLKVIYQTVGVFNQHRDEVDKNEINLAYGAGGIGAIHPNTAFGSLYDQTVGSVQNSPYVNTKSFSVKKPYQGQSMGGVTVTFNMSNPAKFFDERRRAMVEDGDEPWTATNPSGNKWIASCAKIHNTTVATAPIRPANGIFGCLQLYRDVGTEVDNVTRVDSAAITGLRVRVRSTFMCEFFDPETEFTVDIGRTA